MDNQLVNDQSRRRQLEWLEADGLGGFASGTISGIRTRRYHALLLTASMPPTRRFILVNGLDVHVGNANTCISLSTQQYAPDVIAGEGENRIISFENEPWPRWTFQLPSGELIDHEIFAVHGQSTVILSWKIRNTTGDWNLSARPLMSGRDYHQLHQENPNFCFEVNHVGAWWKWQPYEGVPSTTILANASYAHAPVWYRNFLYAEEKARGLDFLEDLASPGIFQWNLSEGEALLVLSVENHLLNTDSSQSLEGVVRHYRQQEKERRALFHSPLLRAADAYFVKREQRSTVIAGYPWFTDWGRDTFISMRGLFLSTGRFQEAAEILLAWSNEVSEGMLPNRFADAGDAREYNSVDASLWFIIVVSDFLERIKKIKSPAFELAVSDRERLINAVMAIVEGYAQGTRFNIKLDNDSLITCGVEGVQLTWMDAKVGDWVVTPRIGKPVEIQALWLNALLIASQFDSKWESDLKRGKQSFLQRFWRNDENFLNDVVDCNYQKGVNDGSFRPNQIFAIGGLPLQLLPMDKAKQVVRQVEEQLWTPMGLRTLSPHDPHYCPQYLGDVLHRDGAYHQGTAWPWLAGAFVEAYLRVNAADPQAKEKARGQFFDPLQQRLQSLGMGHLAEIADGDEPHQPRGCPFQAWSMGELLRIEEMLRD